MTKPRISPNVWYFIEHNEIPDNKCARMLSVMEFCPVKLLDLENEELKWWETNTYLTNIMHLIYTCAQQPEFMIWIVRLVGFHVGPRYLS